MILLLQRMRIRVQEEERLGRMSGRVSKSLETDRDCTMWMTDMKMMREQFQQKHTKPASTMKKGVVT